MEEIKFDLIEKVCEKQNFDELLLQIVKSNKENRINRILQNIEENKSLIKNWKDKYMKESLIMWLTWINT